MQIYEIIIDKQINKQYSYVIAYKDKAIKFNISRKSIGKKYAKIYEKYKFYLCIRIRNFIFTIYYVSIQGISGN